MLNTSDPKVLGDNPSPQEIFDFVAVNLIKQGEPSVEDGFKFCRYRTKKGTKILRCGVGWLIPDDMYEEGMDRTGGYNVGSLESRFHTPKYFRFNMVFLQQLQNIHDQCYTANNFATAIAVALEKFALDNGLKFDPEYHKLAKLETAT